MSDLLLPLIRVDKRNKNELAAKIRERAHDIKAVSQRANRIIGDVRKGGDEALCRYTRELDGAEIEPSGLVVSQREIASAARRVSPELLKAMRFALERIQRTQAQLLRRLSFSYVANGFVIRTAIRPIDSVGCYAPGGRASYASTVLMTAGVAKTAGVKRVVVCSPPGKDGRISDVILAAAGMCEVDSVYAVGGAQSIAALAYGTETVRKVSKIVGPGGIYVAAAKKLVSGDVAIDFFAGPTELVVVGDAKTDPRLAAWDLMGQAEHGQDTICGLVTWDRKLAGDVRRIVEDTVPSLERREHVEGCLRLGFVALCKDRADAAAFVNSLAPEHLEVMLDEGREEVIESISNAGLLLSGSYAPCAASDYCIGTDHVIPTEGVASLRSGLTALDFVKLNWAVEGTKEGLRTLLPPLKELALAEGLPNHFRSVESRFKK